MANNKNQLKFNFPPSQPSKNVIRNNTSGGKIIHLNSRANIYKRIISRTN